MELSNSFNLNYRNTTNKVKNGGINFLGKNMTFIV